MPLRADLSLYDAHGALTGIVEVKNRTGTSGQWAAKTRRNLLAHGLGWRAGFFLLITPDRLYIWKDAGDDPTEVPPTYAVDTGRTFDTYLQHARLAPGQMSGYAFELIVAAWLGDLVHGTGSDVDYTGQDWLEQSGFRAAVRDGRVELDTTA